MASTDIEKENLEAHVELCAERYKNLHDRLDSLDTRMYKIEGLIVDIKQSVSAVPNESNKTIIAIGTAIVGAMIGAIITLIVHIK